MKSAIIALAIILITVIAYRDAILPPYTFDSAKVSGVAEPGSGTQVSTSTRVRAETQNDNIYEWYPVLKAVDGDTIVVNVEGKKITIRLIGLDTPETVD